MKERILLIGHFDIVRHLASLLLEKKYHVIAINGNYQECIALSNIEALTVIHGDATIPLILKAAEAQDTDVVVALTNRDDYNLIICELCKKKFNVKKAVALANDPKETNVFYKMGIDLVVSIENSITEFIEGQF